MHLREGQRRHLAYSGIQERIRRSRGITTEIHTRVNVPISVVTHPLLLLGKPNPQIRPATKCIARPREHNALYPLVYIQHRIQQFKIIHHLHGKGIALLGAVEGHDDDWGGDGGGGRVVGDEDVF
jgi:hypothetical protein